MPHPVLAIRPVTERLIASSTERQVEPRRDELAGAIEGGELLRPLHDLRVQPRVLDRGGQRARHLHQHLHVGVGEGARLVVDGIEGADHVALGEERAPRSRSGSPAATGSPGSRPGGRDPTGRPRVGASARSATHAASVSAGARRRSTPSGSPARAAMSRTRISSRSRSNSVDARARRSARAAHRLGDRVVDVLGGDGARAEGGDLVDHLEAKRSLVQPPDLLHGPAELAREARRDRVGGEPARGHPAPRRRNWPRGLPGVARGARAAARACHRPATPAADPRRLSTPHSPRRLGRRSRSQRRAPIPAARPPSR